MVRAIKVEVEGAQGRTIWIGRRRDLLLDGVILSEGKSEAGNPDDICMFLDIQYGEADTEEIKKQLRKAGLEFDDILIYCG